MTYWESVIDACFDGSEPQKFRMLIKTGNHDATGMIQASPECVARTNMSSNTLLVAYIPSRCLISVCSLAWVF